MPRNSLARLQVTLEPLGSISVGPNDMEVFLGPIELAADADTLWLRVQQTSPAENWKYSYGLASFVSDDGATLGTTKIYGNLGGEIFALGVRRPPSIRTGRIRFVPRHYNLRWISTEGAPKWNLSFQYESGNISSGEVSVAFPVVGGRWVYNQPTGLNQLQFIDGRTQRNH